MDAKQAAKLANDLAVEATRFHLNDIGAEDESVKHAIGVLTPKFLGIIKAALRAARKAAI